MYKNNQSCVAVIAAALAVLIFGMWNLECFRAYQKDPETGVKSTTKKSQYPSYIWLSLLALLTGLFVCMLQQNM
jgi:hypothetical protein